MTAARKSIQVPKKSVGAAASDDGTPVVARRAVKAPEALDASHAQFGAAVHGVESHPETDPDQQDEVTVMVPKSFRLRKVDHSEILITAGVQEVPQWVADHWWSQANGVTIYKGKKSDS